MSKRRWLRTIDPNVVRLGWTSFFTDMASAMVTPILPIFVVNVLHQGMEKLGVIVAIATFVSYALRLLSGYVADRYGIVKPMVVTGYALSALSKPLIGFCHGYKSVATLKALERLGKALRSAPKDMMIAHYGGKRQGRTFGFHKTLDIGGELSGTLLLFLILTWLGESETVMRGIFYGTLLPGLVGVAIVVFWVSDIPPPQRHITPFSWVANDKRIIGKLLYYFGFLLFFFGDAFFTMQASQIGISTALIPLLFVLFTATQTASSYVVGLAVDRWGYERVMGWAYLSGVVALGLLALEERLATWAAFFFFALFTVASLNANRAMIGAQSKNRGSVYGIFYAGVAIAGALGALAIGWIWERWGMEAAIVYALSGTSIVTAIFWVDLSTRRWRGDS